MITPLALMPAFCSACELIQPSFPEREVEIGVDWQSSFVVDDAEAAKIVDERRCADFSSDRVVEADIAVDIDALDGSRRFTIMTPMPASLARRNAGLTEFTSAGDTAMTSTCRWIEIVNCVDLLRDVVALAGQRYDLDVETILAGFSSPFLEEIGCRLKTPDTSGGAQPIVI